MTFSVSLAIKYLLAYGAFKSGILKKRIQCLPPLIVGYHRIISPSQAGHFLQSGMFVTPETFERHMAFLAKNFNVIPLEELITGIKPKAQKKTVCVITFDDGWSDFYKNAYPVLSRLSLPATVFLPTNFIGSNQSFWTDTLSRMLCRERVFPRALPAADPASAAYVHSILFCRSKDERRVEEAISRLKPLPPGQRDAVLNALSAYFEEAPGLASRHFLNWDEIAAMRDSGIISFGSHTASHPILTTITEPQIVDELEQSRAELLSHGAADPSFVPFCYPNGNYSRNIETLVQQAGYSAAVTTQPGPISLPADQYSLCRTLVHQDISSNIPLLAARISHFFG